MDVPTPKLRESKSRQVIIKLPADQMDRLNSMIENHGFKYGDGPATGKFFSHIAQQLIEREGGE